MVAPTIALKAFALVVAGGAVTAIAAPAISSVINYNWPALKKFPAKYQGRGHAECQWLAKDESSDESKKFLFVCRGEEGYQPDFYFYSESQTPILVGEVNKLTEKEDKGDKRVEVTVTLVEDSSINQQQQITISSPVWDVLKNKDSENCSLTNSTVSGRSWTLQCGGGEEKSISLAPMIW